MTLDLLNLRFFSHLALIGRRGHVACIDWQYKQLRHKINVTVCSWCKVSHPTSQFIAQHKKQNILYYIHATVTNKAPPGPSVTGSTKTEDRSINKEKLTSIKCSLLFYLLFPGKLYQKLSKNTLTFIEIVAQEYKLNQNWVLFHDLSKYQWKLKCQFIKFLIQKTKIFLVTTLVLKVCASCICFQI